ncbi:uncharacterized protein LOC121605444 [Chelmon rostratus]|uniref:uncharacterized protein LOC121605444 n=1 Tax=Chelmon rostratus TaxID=109905 RepID=UPI001BE736F1|nr:uncharacterized protein LOC121605444 [Chelmon rostratus]
MLPKHEGPKGVFYAPQRTEPPFELDYKLGNKGEPITGVWSILGTSGCGCHFTHPNTTTTNNNNYAYSTKYCSKYYEAKYNNKYCKAKYNNKYCKANYYNKYCKAKYYSKYCEAKYYSNTALTPPQRGSRISDRTLLQSSTTLIVFDNLFVAVSMELPNIFMITLTGSPFSRDLIKVSQILCSLLCVAVEISALILLCVANSLKVTLIALVCVLIVMSYIKLIIVSLPIGPSHELKHICDVAVKVCSVIHIILTTALVFVGVLEIADCIKKRKESWLLKVIIAYTVWMFLLIVWTFVFSAHRNAILGRRKTGSSKNSNGWRQQRRKKKLGATEATVTAISVILIVGIIAFSAALIAGIFSEKRARA